MSKNNKASYYNTVPMFNFVLELDGNTEDIRNFIKDILSGDEIDLSKLKPEIKHSNKGDQRAWRLSNWGAPSSPKLKKYCLLNGNLVVSASCEIVFPEMALNKLIKRYNLTFKRGICLAEDHSEAFLLNPEAPTAEMPIKTQHLTRMQMRQAGILKML